MIARALLVPAIGIVWLVGGACSRTSPPPVSANATADSADQVALDVRTVVTDDGVQRGVLFADTMYIMDQNSRFDLRVVRLEFTKSNGVHDGTMTADRGRYDLRNSVLEGYGNVRVVTEDGRRLTSPHLRYDQGRNLVSSDSAFTMVQGDRTQTGVGFEADPQLTRFQCKGSCGGTAPVALPVE